MKKAVTGLVPINAIANTSTKRQRVNTYDEGQYLLAGDSVWYFYYEIRSLTYGLALPLGPTIR